MIQDVYRYNAILNPFVEIFRKITRITECQIKASLLYSLYNYYYNDDDDDGGDGDDYNWALRICI